MHRLGLLHRVSSSQRVAGLKAAMSSSTSKPLVIVLTGGPCAGKSTALKHIRDSISARYGTSMGFYSIPEVPTILQLGGCTYPGTDPANADKLLAFEAGILSLQIAMEKSFLSIGSSMGHDAIYVLDRAAFDLRAYMDADLWARTLARCGETEESLMSRYDAVVYLASAANGAEEFYMIANNEARTEGLEEARALDRRTREVFSSRFPADNFHVIENPQVEHAFQAKIDQVNCVVQGIVSRHFNR